MKKLIFLLLLGMLASGLFAQLGLGVKAGLNVSNFKSSEVLTDNHSINTSPTGKLGYHAGAYLRVSLFGVFIQPELVFTSISSDYTVTDLATTTEQIAKQTIGRVDVPVLLGVRLGTLRLGVGPVGSIIVSDKSELSDLTGYQEKMKSATFGYQLAGGADIWKFSLDIRYEGSITKLGDHIMVGGEEINFDTRANQIIFSLGFNF